MTGAVGRVLAAGLLGLIFMQDPAATAQPRTDAEERRIETVFLTGLEVLDAGRPDQAIPIFLDILAAYPDLVRVRLELGRAYFAAERWQLARREFLLALSADLPEPVRLNVLSFIRRIDARRGFEWDLSLALARVGGTESFDSNEILLDFGGTALPFTLERRGSGTGLDVTARARLRTRLSEPRADGRVTTGFVEASLLGEIARERELRDLTGGVRLGLRHSGRMSTAEIALLAERRDIADRHFETRAGLALQAERRNARGLSVFATLTGAQIDNRQTDTLDGTSVEGEVGLSQSLGGRATIGSAVFAERRDTDASAEGYDRYGLSVFGRIEARFGLSVRPSLFVARRDFRDPNALFVNDPDETEYGGTLRVEKTDLLIVDGFFPFVSVGYRRVDSGVEAFSFDETDLAIGLERAF